MGFGAGFDKLLKVNAAGVAKLAYAADSKSAGVHSPWGFKSLLRHLIADAENRNHVCFAVPRWAAKQLAEAGLHVIVLEAGAGLPPPRRLPPEELAKRARS